LESSAGLSWLRGAAWTVFALDLVILLQMAYAVASGGGGDPAEHAALRGFMAGVASSRRRC
jgi:hypothetical protein